MKRIAFIDHTLNGGGAERVMATIMRSLDPEKFEIHLLIVMKIRDLRHLIPEHVKVHELGIAHTRNALFKIRKEISRISPDIVYSTLGNTNILSALAGMGKKHKTISRYSSMPSLELKEGKLRGWRYLLMKLLYRRFDLIIAQSQEMAIEIAQLYKVKMEKIRVIMNPLDVENIEESSKEVINPFSREKINVVASGRIGAEKGFHVLIEAFAKVLKNNNNFHLHIIGKDNLDYRAKLEKRIDELCISEAVTFYGFQKNPYKFYKHLDLFVLSSIREGLPNVILECQYFGKPIVATRCAPIIERLIDQGINGFLVDVEDVDGLSSAILNYGKLKATKKFRDSSNNFVDVFENL